MMRALPYLLFISLVALGLPRCHLLVDAMMARGLAAGAGSPPISPGRTENRSGNRTNLTKNIF
jgi:hypothetical protein